MDIFTKQLFIHAGKKDASYMMRKLISKPLARHMEFFLSVLETSLVLALGF